KEWAQTRPHPREGGATGRSSHGKPEPQKVKPREGGTMVNVRVTRENLVALPALAPYFILGLLSFAAVPWVLLAAAGRLDAGAYRHPLVLAAVHLYALGWGSAVALGALQQM